MSPGYGAYILFTSLGGSSKALLVQTVTEELASPLCHSFETNLHWNIFKNISTFGEVAYRSTLTPSSPPTCQLHGARATVVGMGRLVPREYGMDNLDLL